MYEENNIETIEFEEQFKDDSVENVSFFKKILMIVHSPVEAFKIIKEYSNLALVYFLFVVLTSIAPIVTILDGSAKAEYLKNAAETGLAIDPNFVDSIIAFSAVFVVIGLIIAPLISALLYNIIFMFSGQSGFKKVLTVILYSSLIPAVGSVLLLIINSVLSNDISFAPMMFMDTSNMSTFLQTMLLNVELFNIWNIILMIIGLSVVLEVSKKHATIVWAILFSLGVFISFATLSFLA